jgi:2,4-dienoyl-CoA reductase (NADPH2)
LSASCPPVIVVGKFDAELGEMMLEEGKADFIGMTRRLQADPDYPKKIKEGRLDEIAPCTSCENCLGTRRCRINAFFGTEYNTVDPAGKKKKILVVGGGPAGMEAARVAALRGHDVTLYERGKRLGGLLPVATIVKGTDLENLPLIIQYLEGQLKKLGVTIKTGTEFSSSDIENESPDAVIIATGGVPKLPDIKGIGNRCVVSMAKLHGQLKRYVNLTGPEKIRALTILWMPVGRRAVIIGSGLHGCELAEFSTKRGRKLTVIDEAGGPGKGMIDVILAYRMLWFAKKGVQLINGVSDILVLEDGVEYKTPEGKRERVTADSVIPALPLSSDPDLAGELENKVPEIRTIGDCKEPLLIADAIGAGLRITRNI